MTDTRSSIRVKKIIYMITYFCALLLLPLLLKVIFVNAINKHINLYINLIIYLSLFVFAIYMFQEFLIGEIDKLIKEKDVIANKLLFCFIAKIIELFIQVICAILVVDMVQRNINQSLVNHNLQMNVLITFFQTVILAPFVEEIVFRYIIFRSILFRSRLSAYLISSISFGILHCVYALAKGDLSQLFLLIVYAIPAAIDCYIYEKTDNMCY